jgi:hypothetical protein
VRGPDHYLEAERYAEMAEDIYRNGHEGDIEAGKLAAAIAQVHATLALTAATATLDAAEAPNGGSATGRPDAVEWAEALAGGES